MLEHRRRVLVRALRVPRHLVVAEPQVHPILEMLEIAFVVNDRSFVLYRTAELLIGPTAVADRFVDLCKLKLLAILLGLEGKDSKDRLGGCAWRWHGCGVQPGRTALPVNPRTIEFRQDTELRHLRYSFLPLIVGRHGGGLWFLGI